MPGTSGVLTGVPRSLSAALGSAASKNARQDFSKMKRFAGADLGLKMMAGGELSKLRGEKGNSGVNNDYFKRSGLWK